MLGIKTNRTTAYHPMANGLVERLHRQLKSSIMARSTGTDWMEQLPMVMLGIRTSWRTELDCSPAELVYGAALTVPGLLFGEKNDSQVLPTSEFVSDLMTKMRELRPVEMAHHATAKVHIPTTIGSANYVYIRTDAVRAPLVRPYTGPFKVLEKSAKFFTVLKNGKPDNISVDRLKPAFIYQDNNNETQIRREREADVTQPRVFESQDPETERVPAATAEVTEKSYRDALVGDFPSHGKSDVRHKRKYEKRPKETRTATAATRSGRISRPPVRL